VERLPKAIVVFLSLPSFSNLTQKCLWNRSISVSFFKLFFRNTKGMIRIGFISRQLEDRSDRCKLKRLI
jgi:hypothetical protein